MTDDARALLSAIVADPADDTVRLAYADCIEERGNSTRAEFIRLQIEAERLHPNSNARAALEARAEALFAERWIDWWAEVCEATGLPMPAPKPTGTLGRWGQRVGLVSADGEPYEHSRFAIGPRTGRPYDNRLDGWLKSTFRRGFPDTVSVSMTNVRMPGSSGQSFLARWPAASPLIDLDVGAPYPDLWSDGPHLAGVHRLALSDYALGILAASLGSPHLTRLEELRLFSNEYADDQGVVPEFADSVAVEVTALWQWHLKHLALQVWTDAAAQAVANAEHFSCLTALEVDILPDSSEDRAGAGQRLATLARSPQLAGLQELKVVGATDAAGVAAMIRNPTWAGLRKLELDAQFWYENLDPLAGPSNLSRLEELRLTASRFPVGLVGLLGRSPLVKRLRHLALCGVYPWGAHPLNILDMVDPDRIETLALQMSGLPASLIEALRARFGERFRLIT